MRRFHLWIAFAFTITISSIAGFFLSGFLTFVSVHMNIFPQETPIPWIPFMGFAISSFIASISITLLVTRQFFKPIHRLALGLNEVAAGNFHIQLKERGIGKELQEMTQNFNKMVKELNSIEMLQTDFIQNVSHEIKTPLAAIEGYASLLSSSSSLEETILYSARIRESARQLSSLTGNILKLSRLENQQVISERTTFSLDEQLRQVILTMEPLWDCKQIHLNLTLPEVTYYGSEDLLIQVWTNLLSNAVKFTPEDGSISISLCQTSSQILVKFRDTGIGMTKEEQLHIFDKFYQGDKSRNIDGNGLGLALVKKIISLCGGKIEVESQPDHGSCFTVCLPKT